MGSYLSCLSKFDSHSKSHSEYKLSPPALWLDRRFQECISEFTTFKEPSEIDYLINMIKELAIKKFNQQNNPDDASTSSQDPPKMELTYLFNNGCKFLFFLNEFVEMKPLEPLEKGITLTAKRLYSEGEIFSIVVGFSMITFLLSQIDRVAENRSECFELLRDMIYLVEHVKSLKNMITEEKFIRAIELIVRGSIYCACQLEPAILFRFTKASFDSNASSSIRRKIHMLFPEPFYPHQAVAIEEPVNDIVNLLRPTDESSLAVVIYGLDGIGKTTIAEAVLAEIDLNRYNYTKVAIYQEQENNDFKSLQQQILRDCFPTYDNGKPVVLRDCKDGRDEMVKASIHEKGKPIFLFIDNASRSLDLKELLPTYTVKFPRGSRILLTTRRSAATDIFEKLPNVERILYPLKPLAKKDDALKILLSDPLKRGNIENDCSERILEICRGVPLALKIVSAHLHKQEHLLDALKGKDQIEEEKLEEEIDEEKLKDLSDRLVDFVYNELDKSTQEAFLDICCFFSNWKRQDVEYIVGGREVAYLIEAGLITSIAIPEISYFQEADEVLIVHDIVIAKGRSLAKDNRFMDLKSLCEAADEERLDQIKGIWLVKDKSHYVLQERHLNSMEKSVRVLALGDRMRFSKAKEMKFEELRFLRIGGSIPQLPVKLEVVDNLKVFHGPFSISGEVIMYKLPKGLSAMKIIDNKSKNPEVEQSVPKSSLAMKIMEQSVDNKSKNPEVEQFVENKSKNPEVEVLQCHKLEKLHFTGLRELDKLLKGSIKLDALKTFILEDFSIMEELPQQICSLPSLSKLSIIKSGSLKCLPESFGQLTTLKQLQLSYLVALKTLPSSIREFIALTHLNLEGCRTLIVFPPNLEKLTALTHLSLNGCESLEYLPPDFGCLTTLKYLNLGFCKKLQFLPPTFGHLRALKHLCLRECTMLQTLPSNFRNLGALKYLNLYSCEKLKALPSVFGELRALKCLECSLELKEKVKSQIGEQVLIVAY